MGKSQPKIVKRAANSRLLEDCEIQLSFGEIFAWTSAWASTADPSRKFPSKKVFAQKILPNDLYRIFSKSDCYHSRLFNPCKESSSLYAHARELLLSVPENGVPVTFESHPICHELTNKWVQFLESNRIPLQDLPAHIRQCVQECTPSADSSSPLAERLQRRIDDLLSEDYPEGLDTVRCAQALATMSLIACTLFCWREQLRLGSDRCADFKQNRDLYNLVLPASRDGQFVEDLERAQEQLEQSRTFDLSQQANQELLQKLSGIADSCQESRIKGWAFFLLHLAYQLNGDSVSSAEEYLKKSADQGYPQARSEQAQAESNKTARSLLEQAEQEYANDKIRPAYEKCRELLALRPEPSDTDLIGRTAMLIYNCSQSYYRKSKKSLLSGGEKPEQYLKKSRDCGNKDAIRLCADHLDILPRLSRSGEDSKGVYYFNCCNPLTKQIQTTAPDKWRQAMWGGTQTVTLEPAQNAHYYFLDDDQMVNLRDALCVLDALQNSAEGKAAGQDKSNCEGPELYIRGQTEFLRPLIDTAISRMTGRMIPLYLIDDDLWPAQWLLAHHPLFYPIRSLPETSPSTLKLVVVGDTRCSEWVVREAFALMGFINDNVKCEITVIAPRAEEFKESLFFKCPGLQGKDEIARLPRPTLTFCSCGDGFRSQKVEPILLSCYQQQDAYCYYIIDTGVDAVNLSLASRLREMLIRAVLSGPHNVQAAKLNAPPPIAFCYRDPFTAHLSKRLVTEMESYGDQWYNSPCLIPFGSNLDRYTWQNAAGGFYEDIAKNIHLQHAFADRSAIPSPCEREQIAQDALSEYFRRCYNRESSLSVAISLPYRLFQFEVHDAADSRHLIPSCWQITDPNTYCTETQLKALGRLLKLAPRQGLNQGKKIITQTEQVAKWEHDRWSRWMLARGWLPESIDQAADCYSYGNKRHQLYIARLHPCICAYDRLGQLANAWKFRTDESKDFTSFDQKSIQETLDILELKWYRKETAAKEKSDDERERG